MSKKSSDREGLKSHPVTLTGSSLRRCTNPTLTSERKA